MSATDELRAAAVKLRRLAKDATPGPWRDSSVDGLNRYAALVSDTKPEGRSPDGGWDDIEGYGGYLIGESLGGKDRAYIATVNPVLALALADLLDAHADDFDWDEEESDNCCGPDDVCWECARNKAVLEVARAINGAS
jgi:hypothetical protein